jgi:hypothetical protein
MRRPTTLPIVREAILNPFIYGARRIGAPTQAILQSVGLPTLLAGDAELLPPELPCWHLYNGLQDGKTFRIWACQQHRLQHTRISRACPLIGRCINLYEVLKRVCSIAPKQSSINDYALRDEEELVWLEQRGYRLLAEDVQIQLPVRFAKPSTRTWATWIVNTPPAQAGGVGLRLKAGSIGHAAD